MYIKSFKKLDIDARDCRLDKTGATDMTDKVGLKQMYAVMLDNGAQETVSIPLANAEIGGETEKTAIITELKKTYADNFEDEKNLDAIDPRILAAIKAICTRTGLKYENIKGDVENV